MTELLDAVDELTLPKPVKVTTDTGFTWATEDPLLVQLQEAVSSSLKSGSGSGGSPWTRNVLDGDALHHAAVITSTIGDWCRMAGATVTRDPIIDLRAWYVRREGSDNPDAFYLTQLRKWAGQIRAAVNPPKVVEITAACPVCGQGEYTNDMGENVRNPLVLTYRPDADNLNRSARVMCRSCEAVWAGGEAMVELRDELDEKETA